MYCRKCGKKVPGTMPLNSKGEYNCESCGAVTYTHTEQEFNVLSDVSPPENTLHDVYIQMQFCLAESSRPSFECIKNWIEVVKFELDKMRMERVKC